MISRVSAFFQQLFSSSNSTAKSKGNWGEDLAAAYLRSEANLKIVARNWRHKRDEIDIIAVEGGAVLVFVEVRLRKAHSKVPGFYSVNQHKKQKLRRGCRAYLKQLRKKPKHFRFDIVEIRLQDEGAPEINHYKNVILFSKDFLP